MLAGRERIPHLIMGRYPSARFWFAFASFASDSHCTGTYYHVMKVVVDCDVDFVQKTLCRYSNQHQRLQMQ